MLPSSKKSCLYENCTEKLHIGKLCEKHFNVVFHSVLKTNPSSKECRYRNCQRQREVKGFCSTCYFQIKYKKWPVTKKERPKRAFAKKFCNEPGCDELMYALGKCNKHYNRLRYDRLQQVHTESETQQKCIHPDCDVVQFKKERCHKHYLLHKESEHMCAHDGCTEKSYKHNYCRIHVIIYRMMIKSQQKV